MEHDFSGKREIKLNHINLYKFLNFLKDVPTIYALTFVFNRKDVETMLGILEKEVPKEFAIGLNKVSL